MRPRTLLALLVAVLALAAFVAFYERDLPGSEAREAAAKKVLPGVASDDVTAVTIEQGEQRVRIERAAGDDAAQGAAAAADGAAAPPAGVAGDWRLTAPAELAGDRADGAAVAALVDRLVALEKSRQLLDARPEDVGLAPPRARVVLERRDGDPVELAVGADVPASDAMVLARRDTGATYLVDRAVFGDLGKPPGEWRSHDVFTADRESIRRVTLTGNGSEVVLERRDGGFWLAQPFDDRADADAVDRLLTDLVGLRVDHFLDPPAPPAGALDLEPPRTVVTADVEGGGEPLRVEIGAPAEGGAGGNYYRVGDQLFVAQSDLPGEALRPAPEWQSKALLAHELYEVEGLAVTGGGEPLHLERSGTDWKRNGKVISYTPVSDLLFALSETRADEVAPRAGTPPGKPALTFELTTRQGAGEGASSARETVTLFPPRGGHVPATVSGRAVTLLLPADALDTLRTDLAHVREAKPITPPADDVPPGVGVERDSGD